MAVYDISKPGDPRQIGFMPVEGTGLHRLWYVGGRWAYASALLDGFSDYILITIDMPDPQKPRAGRQILAAGHERRGRRNGQLADHERPLRAPPSRSFTTTSPIAPGATPASSVVDVKDKANPKLIAHKVWAPPFGGGTHNALPLPDRKLLIVVDETVLDNQEDGFKPIWVFDNQVQVEPDQHRDLPGARRTRTI